jgi:hypothetical protein
MKRIGLALAAGILFGAGALAQTQTGGQANTAANEQRGTTLASGTAINAELSTSVDSKKAKPGDPVKAKITEAVTSNGQAVLPKGAQLVGHVTEASARAKGGNESSLGIVFDKAVLKHGEEVPLNVSIQALATGVSPAGGSAPPMNMDPYAGVNSSGSRGGGMPGGGASGGGTRGSTGASTASNPGSTGYPTSTADNTGQPTVNTGGANGGLDASGHLAPSSRGVYGLEGLALNKKTQGTTQSTLITSTGKNVHLDSGTKMLLVTEPGLSATQRPAS